MFRGVFNQLILATVYVKLFFLSPFWQRKIESHNISLKNLTLTVLGKTLSFLAKS